MKSITLRKRCATALAAIGLAACDAAPPPAAPVEPDAVAPTKTLTDMVAKELADVLQDPDAYSRARRLGTLLPTLGPELVESVKRTLDDRLLDYRATEIDLLMRYWATHEPEEAALWAKRKSAPDYRSASVYSALRVWAEADPQAATSLSWEWAADVPELERIVPVALVRGWYAVSDPVPLRRWIHDLPPGILRQRAIAAYIRVLMEKESSDAAIRWAESLPDDEQGYKLTVFRRLTGLLSALDVEAGKRWCERHCGGPYGKNMRGIIARQWVVHDGPAALAWLSGALPGFDRDLAVRTAWATWSRREAGAAMAWLEAETGGKPAHADEDPMAWLRPAYPVYARLLAAKAPADAIPWAERTESEQERRGLLIAIAKAWRDVDEAAADAWLDQSPLPDEARQEVRAWKAPAGQPPG